MKLTDQQQDELLELIDSLRRGVEMKDESIVSNALTQFEEKIWEFCPGIKDALLDNLAQRLEIHEEYSETDKKDDEKIAKGQMFSKKKIREIKDKLEQTPTYPGEYLEE